MRFTALGTVLLLVPAVAAFASVAELSGTWQGTLDTPIGALPAAYTFATTGQTFSGWLTLSGSDQFPIADGRISGDSVFFSVDLSAVVLHHRGRLAGDTLHVAINDGTAEFGAALARVAAK
jgi:hypothetical protein